MLIGTSGVGNKFTKEVVEAMASINEVIFCLSTNMFEKLYLHPIEVKAERFVCLLLVETYYSRSFQPNFTV